METVICVVDARTVTDQPSLLDDALWQAQLHAADYIALSKTDLVAPAECDALRAKLAAHKAENTIYDMVDGRLPPELHFWGDQRGVPVGSGVEMSEASSDFRTVSWTSQSPLVMSRFREVIDQFSSSLVRAKGFVRFAERPDDVLLFQLVGRRATLGRAPAGVPSLPAVQLVFIGKRNVLDERRLLACLAGCREDGTG